MQAAQLGSPASWVPPQGPTGAGEEREAMIRKAAQLLARWRGLEPGPEPEDWRTAAAQIDELLRVSRAALEARAGARSVADIRRSQSART